MTDRSKNHLRRSRNHGLSLVELLISLAISAALLTATMVALDVSFKAYAEAAEQASSQAATRMITNRLLTLIRTSTAHGPLQPNAGVNPPVTLNGNQLTSNFIRVIAPNGDDITVTYNNAAQQLDYNIIPATGPVPPNQPFTLLGGVTNGVFTLTRRQNNDGIWVLDRGTMQITVVPSVDSTLAIESGNATPIFSIASTRPRRIQ